MTSRIKVKIQEAGTLTTPVRWLPSCVQVVLLTKTSGMFTKGELL